MTRGLVGLSVAVMLVLGCGHGEAEWQGKLREISTLQGQLRDLTGERDHLREQFEGMQSSNTTMARRLEELGQNVSQLQAQGQQQATALTEAQQREAELRAEGQQVLRQVATVLAQIRDRDFLVAGHTDNVQLGRGGRFADNWDLSAARALNVVRFLASSNVAAVHLGGAGYGEHQPARANDTDDNRAQNRRVEIILMPNIEELPDLSSLDNAAPAPAPPAPAPAPAR